MNPQPAAGITLSLSIGQHVRHRDHQGRRVTGVVQALTVEDRGLLADIVLDQPIVLPARGEFGEARIHKQCVPAHELAPFDERDELIEEMLAALRSLLDHSTRANEVMLHEAGIGIVGLVPMERARAAIARATGAAL